MSKGLDKQGYNIIIEDNEMEIRNDPREERGYVLCLKKDKDKFIFFPRGTLEELAKADRNRGREIIDNLVPMHYERGRFFQNTNLTYDSVIAITTKAYLREMEDYMDYIKNQ